MKALFHFIFRSETTAYLRWRWRQEGWRSFRIVWEWIAVLAAIRFRKSRRPQPVHNATSHSAEEQRDPTFQHYFLRPDQVAPLAGVIKTQFPTDVNNLIRQADAIVSEGQIPLPTRQTANFRKYGWRPPFDDLEHFLALHRWSFGVVLAKAWAYSGKADYVECFATMFQSWVKANPSNPNNPAWESYSVSERIVHWCFCTVLFWDAPRFRENIYPKLAQQLSLHADWLSTHLETEKIHNHLINNARALYTAGTFLDKQDYRTLGWTLLEKELLRQVFPDGFLHEQSVPYQLLLTRTFIEGHSLATLAKEKISLEFTGRVRRMVEVAAAFVRPDGSCPLIGDISPDIELKALTGAVAAGQIRFQLPQTVPMTEEGAWLAGAVAGKPSASRDMDTVFLPDAGYVIHRTNDAHLVFHADPRAEVTRHGHADALGICLWQGGREILRDSGNFSYRFDRWWDYFHGPAGHNGISMGGLPCYPLTDFLAPLYNEGYRRAETKVERPRSYGAWTCAAGWHSGFSRLGDRMIVRRRWIQAPEYLWVTDWMEGRDQQPFEARWNLAKPEGSGLSLVWVLNGVPTKAEWHEGWHSPAYGIKEAASIARISGHHTNEVTRLDLLIGWGKQAPAKLVIADKGHETVESSEWSDVFEVNPEASRFDVRRRQVGAMV